jgi:hypothetical protein
LSWLGPFCARRSAASACDRPPDGSVSRASATAPDVIVCQLRLSLNERLP